MLPGLPISWNKNQYQEGTNEYVAVRPELKKQIEELYRKHPEEARDSFGEDPFEVKNILKYWVFSEKPEFHVIPTDTINIHIDKDALLRSGIMLPQNNPTFERGGLEGCHTGQTVYSFNGYTYVD